MWTSVLLPCPPLICLTLGPLMSLFRVKLDLVSEDGFSEEGWGQQSCPDSTG